MDRRKFSHLVACGAGSTIASLAAQAHSSQPQTNESQATGSAPKPKQLSAVVNQSPTAVEPVAVYEYEALARAALPRPTFEYISTGSADQVTVRENLAAYQRIHVVPPLLRGVTQPDLSTTALGEKISLPVILAPVAGQRMYHADGALAAARAAADAKTIMGISSSVLDSVEEVAQASTGPKWFQLYAPKDREIGKRLIQRAQRAGFRAIILTVDLGEWKDADRRNRFTLPREMMIKHLRDFGFVGNFEQMTHDELISFNASVWDMGMTWEIVDWLRDITRLPVLLKGVLRPDDAVRAVSKGVQGIVVSNHGGRRLDTMPATIDVVESIAQSVAGKVEIYLDGGIRRGTDVLKAIALGARAVLIGRPYVWALAAEGETGVKNVLELLRSELTNAMSACGCNNTAAISRDLITRSKLG